MNVVKDGVTGRICNNGWSLAETNVTCRQLGYRGGVPYSHPALDTKPVILSNISCTGKEASLNQCMTTKWGDAYRCRSDLWEAGVVCYNQCNELIIYAILGPSL